MVSIIISDEEFQTLPQQVQTALLARFTSTAAQPERTPWVSSNAEEEEDAPDLSPAQARKFFGSCSERTQEVVRFIAENPEEGFRLPDLEAAMEVEAGGLKGSWTGITKVCRRILGDENANLIWWSTDSDGVARGRFSAYTRRSFRKILGIE